MMTQFITSKNNGILYLCVDYYDTYGPKVWEVIKVLQS